MSGIQRGRARRHGTAALERPAARLRGRGWRFGGTCVARTPPCGARRGGRLRRYSQRKGARAVSPRPFPLGVRPTCRWTQHAAGISAPGTSRTRRRRAAASGTRSTRSHLRMRRAARAGTLGAPWRPSGGTKPTKRYCGRTVITIRRRKTAQVTSARPLLAAGSGAASSRSPSASPTTGRPALFDQLAKMAAAQAIAKGFGNWLVLDEEDSDAASGVATTSTRRFTSPRPGGWRRASSCCERSALDDVRGSERALLPAAKPSVIVLCRCGYGARI